MVSNDIRWSYRLYCCIAAFPQPDVLTDSQKEASCTNVDSISEDKECSAEPWGYDMTIMEPAKVVRSDRQWSSYLPHASCKMVYFVQMCGVPPRIAGPIHTHTHKPKNKNALI